MGWSNDVLTANCRRCTRAYALGVHTHDSTDSAMITLGKQQLARLFSRLLETPECSKHGPGNLAVCPFCDRVECKKCNAEFCRCKIEAKAMEV